MIFSSSRRRRRLALVVAFMLCATVTGCAITHDGDQLALDPADPNNFDAQAYVGAMWQRKALQFFDAHAYPLSSVLETLAKDKDVAGKRYGHRGDEGSPWTFAVRGTGVVQTVNTASHHGEIVIKVGPPGHTVAATLQIGPIIYGTAVRDSLPFIAFGDFVNQVQYAQVSRALNDQAVKLAHAGLGAAPRPGMTVEFVGAMTDSSDTTITPVRLRPAAVSLK